MAAIDLGGGSVQEAFALTDAQAKAAPDPLYITQLKGGGRTYSVYVHRYLLPLLLPLLLLLLLLLLPLLLVLLLLLSLLPLLLPQRKCCFCT